MTENTNAPEGKAVTGRTALIAGGLAALLASACCVGPLLLLTLGFGGAWMGSLTALGPYQPIFLAVAVVAMVLAYRRIFRPAADCAPGEVCALPQVNATYRVLFWVVAALVLVAFGFPFVAPLFY